MGQPHERERQSRIPGELPATTTAPRTRSVLDRGLDTSGGLDFVRERLALLGKTVFLLSFGFYVFLLASMVLLGGAPFAAVVRSPVALGHLCATSALGLLWLLARRPTASPATLGLLDAGSLLVG